MCDVSPSTVVRTDKGNPFRIVVRRLGGRVMSVLGMLSVRASLVTCERLTVYRLTNACPGMLMGDRLT